MHTTRAQQLTLVELIDTLEAKIAAMRARNGEPANQDGTPPAEMATAWKTPWGPRANGRQHPKSTHPFSNIEEL